MAQAFKLGIVICVSGDWFTALRIILASFGEFCDTI